MSSSTPTTDTLPTQASLSASKGSNSLHGQDKVDHDESIMDVRLQHLGLKKMEEIIKYLPKK